MTTSTNSSRGTLDVASVTARIGESGWRRVKATPRPVDPSTYREDDWFRYYSDGTFDVHELCLGCEPDGSCPFHPVGCTCSNGACQEDF